MISGRNHSMSNMWWSLWPGWVQAPHVLKGLGSCQQGSFSKKVCQKHLARLGDQTCALSLIMPLMSDLRAIWRSTWILAALGLVVAGIRDSCSGYAGFRSLLLFAGLSFLSLSLCLSFLISLSISLSLSLSLSLCLCLFLALSVFV